MAQRTTEEIIETMDLEQASQSALSGLTSGSQTAIHKLFKYIVAQCQYILEGLWEAKKNEIEAIINEGVAPSTAWVRRKAFEFQYDATIPQVMTLVNYVPTYSVIDETKRIITRCTVTSGSGVVTVLVAKSEPPVKLSAGELNSIQGYFINSGDGTTQAVGIGWAGQSISLYTLDPDLLYMEGTITYYGNYAPTIVADTILAIETFISDLGQNPILVTNDLIYYLKTNVTGFKDIFINNMYCRTAATAWAGIGTGTDIIINGDIQLTSYTAAAGYMIGEDEPTFTLLDKLVFTAV